MESTVKTDINNVESTVKKDINNMESTVKKDINNMESTEPEIVNTQSSHLQKSTLEHLLNSEFIKRDWGMELFLNSQFRMKTQLNNLLKLYSSIRVKFLIAIVSYFGVNEGKPTINDPELLKKTIMLYKIQLKAIEAQIFQLTLAQYFYNENNKLLFNGTTTKNMSPENEKHLSTVIGAFKATYDPDLTPQGGGGGGDGLDKFNTDALKKTVLMIMYTTLISTCIIPNNNNSSDQKGGAGEMTKTGSIEGNSNSNSNSNLVRSSETRDVMTRGDILNQVNEELKNKGYVRPDLQMSIFDKIKGETNVMSTISIKLDPGGKEEQNILYNHFNDFKNYISTTQITDETEQEQLFKKIIEKNDDGVVKDIFIYIIERKSLEQINKELQDKKIETGHWNLLEKSEFDMLVKFKNLMSGNLGRIWNEESTNLNELTQKTF